MGAGLSEKKIRAVIVNRMPAVNKKREAAEWYAEHLPELKGRYNSKFIAILGRGEDIRSSESVDGLIELIKSDDPSTWFIKFISEGRIIYA
jgi:hypothetical protein